MSEWATALIAAGSALAGSLVTGWFTRTAGVRQAEAARHAGDRQADALLDTVREQLADQRAVRTGDLRRETYVRFLDAAETALLAMRTGDGAPGDRAALQRALGAVELQGPEEVAGRARELVERLYSGGYADYSPDELERTRREFRDAARAALAGTVGTGGGSGPGPSGGSTPGS